MIQTQKPTYLFAFSDKERSEQFLKFADSYSKDIKAFHPFDREKRCSLNPKSVLVIGTGSHLFDFTLRDALKKQAEMLGGYMNEK